MHTEGKWEVNSTIIQDGTGYTIAQVWPDIRVPSDVSLSLMKDNARLIAAAPETAKERDELKAVNAELLEALNKIYSIEDYRRKLCGISDLSSPPLPKSEIQKIAKAAIAKAEQS